jgi:hypothetical protein
VYCGVDLDEVIAGLINRKACSHSVPRFATGLAGFRLAGFSSPIPNEISSFNYEWKQVRTAFGLATLVFCDAFGPQGNTRKRKSRDCGYCSLRKRHASGRRKIYDEKTHFSDSDSFIIGERPRLWAGHSR